MVRVNLRIHGLPALRKNLKRYFEMVNEAQDRPDAVRWGREECTRALSRYSRDRTKKVRFLFRERERERV